MGVSIKKLACIAMLPTFLSACNGAESIIDTIGSGTGSSGSGSGDDGGSTTVTLPVTDSPILLAYFLENLDSVRTAANALLNDARYQLQVANGDYYADNNNNGQFDPGVDVILYGNPIEHSGIHYAHAAGLTGDGQTIAISDSGFRTSHETLDGKTVTTGTGLTSGDHGTFVASVAAGNSDDMIGVAPEADLILGNYDTFAQLTETANAATAAGAVAYNNSWGFIGTTASTTSFNAIFGSSAGADYLQALRDYAEDGVVVFAIDNDNTLTEIDLLPGLPILVPELEDGWIAVVNAVPVQENDDITSAQLVSSACFEAAAWCLTADGSWTGANANSDSSYDFGTGTSYASPTVSGALALLAEAFPGLTPHDLRIRLFASADNEFDGFNTSGSVELVPGFDHDYSDEFGHGFLDVAAALLPIGQATVTTGNGTTFNSEQAMVVTGGASGDAVSQALADLDIISTDTLAAQFLIPADALVIDTPTSPLFSNNDVQNFSGIQNASYGTASFFGDGMDISSFGDEGVSLSIYQRTEAGEDSFGVGASRSFDLDGATLELSTAFGDDTGGVLSNWTGGTDASLFSASMAITADLSSQSQIRFETGFASGRETSALGQSANVLMNSAALSLSRNNTFARNDRLDFTVYLPAAVTRGSTSIDLPVRSANGDVTFRSMPIDLAPDKREMRVALTYARPLSRSSSLGFSVAHAQNRGNIAGQRETGLMVSFNKSF